MAECSISSLLDKITSNHLECPICHDKYDHPKALECMHNFCTHCLHDLRKPSPSCKAITCPICRQTTILPRAGVDGLKNNFPLVALVDDITREENAQKKWILDGDLACESCNESKRAYYLCFDCLMYLCQTCRVVHKRVPVLAKHMVVTLDDLNSGKYGPSCQHHSKERKRFYCNICHEMVCPKCAKGTSNSCQHTLEKIKDAARIGRVTLKKLASKLKNRSTTIETNLETEKERCLTPQQSCKVATEIKQHAAMIRCQIAIAENGLLDQLKEMDRQRAARFREHEKEVNTVLQQIIHSVDLANLVADSSSNGDFLAVFGSISKVLKDLTSQNVPKADIGLNVLEFRKNEASLDIELGRIASRIHFEPFRPFGDNGSLKLDVGWISGVAALSQGGLAVADREKRSLLLLGSLGKVYHSLKVDDYLNNLATIGNRLVVVDRSRTVKVFDSNFALSFQFQTQSTADDESDKPVDLQSVTLKPNGNILVGDVRQKLVTEHDPTDGSIVSVTPVNTRPYFIVVDSKGSLLISDWNRDQIDGVNNMGDTVFRICPSIGSKTLSCRGLCVTGTGNIFVAVEAGEMDTGHIHSYDPDGKFLDCMVKGLHNPYGIAITSEGYLAVADWDTLKVFY